MDIWTMKKNGIAMVNVTKSAMSEWTPDLEPVIAGRRGLRHLERDFVLRMGSRSRPRAAIPWARSPSCSTAMLWVRPVETGRGNASLSMIVIT